MFISNRFQVSKYQFCVTFFQVTPTTDAFPNGCSATAKTTVETEQTNSLKIVPPVKRKEISSAGTGVVYLSKFSFSL
jgi:hypothetical protein